MITSRTGVGVLPKMTYTGRLHPKGVPFSGFRCMKGKGFHWHEGVGISLAEVYEGVGKSVILVFKWSKRTNRCILWLWKSRGNVVAFWFIPILKKAHLQQLKGMQSSMLGMLEEYHLWIEGVWKGCLFCHNWAQLLEAWLALTSV